MSRTYIEQMSALDVQQKLAILADAAKYDASCASSGSTQARQPRRQGDRLDRAGHGHLPRLCAGRALHLAAEDPADQFLHLRLPLLHQPQELERPPRALHGGGGGAAHPRFLPAQLYRGSVPLLGHHPLLKLHDGADRRGRAKPARGSRFPRLYPPQDHPGRRSRADPPGGAPCRPDVDQCRAADRGRPRPARAGKGCRPDRGGDAGAQDRYRRRRRTRRRVTGRRRASRPPASRRR